MLSSYFNEAARKRGARKGTGMENQETTQDAAKVEAFGDKVVGILNDGSLALMISIGHRTGLFDTMAGAAPGTSEEIADSARLPHARRRAQ